MRDGPTPRPDERGPRIVWSQDPMWKRTAAERWVARHGRRLVLAALLVCAWAGAATLSGAILADQLMHPPRRQLGPSDLANARAVAGRTGSRLSDEALRAADNALLRAWWFVPRETSRGTVVLLHGQADNRAAMLGLAERLLSDGYRVLAPDARAHGTSGGELATYGVLERVDLRMWAEWALQQFPDQCVFGAGASMGGAILIQTLPDVPFCAAVTDSSFADLPTLARQRLGSALHLPRATDGVVAGPVVAAAMAFARARYGVRLRDASPAARLSRARVPLLVVHGTDDREIPVADARALAAANPRIVTLWLVPGGAHTGSWAAAPVEYPRRLLAFLAAHQ